MGYENMWRLTFQKEPQYWGGTIMDEIRRTLRVNPDDMRDSPATRERKGMSYFEECDRRATRVFEECDSRVGFDRTSGRLGHPFTQWDHEELKQHLCVHERWMEQYVGATGVSLMFQFVGAILRHAEESMYIEVDMFVRNTCQFLATIPETSAENIPDVSNRIVMEVLQNIISFMASHRQKIGGVIHGARKTVEHQITFDAKCATNEMDIFIKDLFTILASIQVEGSMMVSIWTLLQVMIHDPPQYY
jgi:hypothetical protein